MTIKIVTKQVREYVIDGLSTNEIYDLLNDGHTQEQFLYEINKGEIEPYRVYMEYISDMQEEE
tara:strand:- start:731 stop:919 length:189 start_codon:yes stop_codon:yes gene_type:complete